MGNAALLLRAMGHDIVGADQNVYPPMSEQLAAAGVEILPGYDAQRLQRLNPDLVVVGNVNSRGNPEVEWLLSSRAIPYASLPEALNKFVLRARRNIVVCGTHGKTTTSTLAAYILRAAGKDPGWMIGGVPLDLPGGANAGDGNAPFVIEGDEYDSAFFDKRSKFLHYSPSVVVLNNLEFDHADIFRDLQDVQRTFNHLLRIVPGNGCIVANGDDANIAALLNVSWVPVLRVGVGATNDLRIADFNETEQGSSFKLIWRSMPWAEVSWACPGLYNARNAAMAALAAAQSLGLDPLQLELSCLQSFQGVKRRQELLWAHGGTTVLSDFGHHPTAIRETLLSLRARYPRKILTACFEARSNTACRNILQNEFANALSVADRVHLGAVFRAERYRDEERLNTRDMAAAIGTKAMAHRDNEELLQHLKADIRTDQARVVCFFSNGSFDGIMPRLLADLKASAVE